MRGDVPGTGPAPITTSCLWPAIPETSPSVLISVIRLRSKCCKRPNKCRPCSRRPTLSLGTQRCDPRPLLLDNLHCHSTMGNMKALLPKQSIQLVRTWVTFNNLHAFYVFSRLWWFCWKHHDSVEYSRYMHAYTCNKYHIRRELLWW